MSKHSPLEERLLALVKRQEALITKQERERSRIVEKLRDKLNHFMLMQVQRERNYIKRMETVEAMMLKLMRQNSSLIDALKEIDHPAVDDIAKDVLNYGTLKTR